MKAFQPQKPDHGSPGGRSAGRASRDRDSRTRERFVQFPQISTLHNCSISESSGIQNQRTGSQSQKTEDQDHGIEDRDQNTGSQGRETGGQGLGTEGQGQETGGQGQKTADQGRKNVNRDTGPGQGTSPGTEEIDQGKFTRYLHKKIL